MKKILIQLLVLSIVSYLGSCMEEPDKPSSVSGKLTIEDLTGIDETKKMYVRLSYHSVPTRSFVIGVTDYWEDESTSEMFYLLYPPVGKYFVCAWMDMDDNDELSIGDRLGYYNDNYFNPNVTIPGETDVFDIDIILTLVDNDYLNEILSEK